MSGDEVPMTPAGRQSAHILLDAIAAWDGANPNDFAASDLAIQRLLEVGAVQAVHDPETGQIDIDISAVLQGASITMLMLIGALAASLPGGTILGVIAAFRPKIDELP